ncbi:hypothetical protein GOP47_0030854, partial [Adiantum capillus-veneris]
LTEKQCEKILQHLSLGVVSYHVVVSDDCNGRASEQMFSTQMLMTAFSKKSAGTSEATFILHRKSGEINICVFWYPDIRARKNLHIPVDVESAIQKYCCDFCEKLASGHLLAMK